MTIHTTTAAHVCRSARPDAGGDVGGADEHVDVGVQQLQQHVHPGPVDPLPAPQQ